MFCIASAAPIPATDIPAKIGSCGKGVVWLTLYTDAIGNAEQLHDPRNLTDTQLELTSSTKIKRRMTAKTILPLEIGKAGQVP